jgi:signal transduction histidine kinase
MVGNVGVGSVTAVVLWLSGMHDGVPLWFGTVLALVALRTWHARGMTERIAHADAAGLRRLRLEIAGLMSATALTWGLMPWLSYHGENPLLDFFSITMLVGMTAGAVQSAAAVPLALRSYIVLGFSPFVVKSVFIGGIIFTMLIWLSYARSAFRIVHRTLAATRENEALAEALRQERDAVRNAMRAKDLFLAGVSHDLRQPVHAIALYLHVLRSLRQDELSPDAVDRAASPIETACRTMSTQLSRLLELSRLEAGEARVHRSALPAAQLLDALRATFAPQAESKGLDLRFSAPPEVWLDTDPRLLQSMADNLVSNALRYTQAGGVLVSLRRWQGRWRLAVQDTGPGFDEALLPEMCTPYRRFDDSQRGTQDAGQGLGLALVARQAQLLGHELVVRSRPGRGSSFSLLIPAAAPGALNG